MYVHKHKWKDAPTGDGDKYHSRGTMFKYKSRYEDDGSREEKMNADHNEPVTGEQEEHLHDDETLQQRGQGIQSSLYKSIL